MTDHRYSVLMSVYYKENPRFLKESIESMLSQTVRTDDFILVCDGPLTDGLDRVIEGFRQEHQEFFRVYRLENNVGLGRALSYGILKCKNEIVARMDSDDIADTGRCEKQLQKLEEGYDIVGSNVDEFVEDTRNIIARRLLPEKSGEIAAFSRKRNPFNHPSVMYRKQSVLKAGNYQHLIRLEDYQLWIHMLMHGCRGYNIQECLVHMRVSKDAYQRKGGIELCRSLYRLKRYMLEHGYISKKEFWGTLCVHCGTAILPSRARELVYLRFLRKEQEIDV